MAKFDTYQRIMKMYHICKLLVYAVLLRVFSIRQILVMATTADQKRYNHHQSHQVNHHPHISPQDMGLRPANPLDEVPIVDLVETATSADDPRLSDLNVTALRLKLGSNLDLAIMSIVPPDETDRRDLPHFGFRRNRLGRLIPTGTMPEYLTKIDFKYLRLTNGSKLRTRISSKLKRKIQQFLWAYTACPVMYRWKDLGIRFWPRYLKTGYCPQNVSCSVPPGMTCRPSATTHKTLLRWFCKNYSSSMDAGTVIDSDSNAVLSSLQRYCQWIKVDYPLLTECSCSCATETDIF